MKKILVCLTVVLCLFPGCKKAQSIYFCEGVNDKGEQVNCGTVFSTGELTAVIKSRKNFETDRISVNICRVEEGSEQSAATMELDVKPDAATANATLPFYNTGLYRVRVIGKDKEKLAEGDIEISDN